MERILIVEDEASIRKALMMGLASKEYEVDVAADGNSGILQGRQKEYDILIADLCLPDMNGLDVIKKVKQNSPEIIPIVITGNSSMESSFEAIRLEVSDYLEKPLTLESVKKSINTGLKKRALKRKTMRKKLQQLLDIYKSESSGNSDVDIKTQNTRTDQLLEKIPMLVHQINNPLMSISGSAELAMIQLDEADAMKKCLAGIIEDTKKITKINKEILKPPQPEEEKIEVVDIRTVLNDCLNMFKDLMTLKEVYLEKETGSPVMSVMGNKFSLEQIFKNLILNAIDSMDESPEKFLRIRIEENKDVSMISVYIEDTGCGIPLEEKDRIFKPNFTTKKHGTGLGLPVVKNILEKHNGMIDVESKKGEGTTFTVKLPTGD